MPSNKAGSLFSENEVDSDICLCFWASEFCDILTMPSKSQRIQNISLLRTACPKYMRIQFAHMVVQITSRTADVSLPVYLLFLKCIFLHRRCQNDLSIPRWVLFCTIFSKALPVSQIIGVLNIYSLQAESGAYDADFCAFCVFLSAPLPISQKPTRCKCLFKYPRLEPKAMTKLSYVLCALSNILKYWRSLYLNICFRCGHSEFNPLLRSKCNAFLFMFGLFRPEIHNHHHHVSASPGLLGAHVKYRNQQSLCCCKVCFLLHHILSFNLQKK
jgi:hypothetical protein